MNNLSEEELEFIRKTKEKVENMNLFKQSNWTEEEKEYLLNSDKNFTEIAKELNKSSSSVRSMASHMGIKKPHRQWESEKVANLIKHYSDPNITISQICQLLGETKGAVDYQVRKLGLKKATNLGWTADQEELLRQLYCEENETIELIAQKLGKNTPAVNFKIARMKLKRNKRK